MSTGATAGTAHDAAVRTQPSALTKLRERVDVVVSLCLERARVDEYGEVISDLKPIWSSEVLSMLKVGHLTGSAPLNQHTVDFNEEE